MNISELQAKAARLEQELQETHQLLAEATLNPVIFTADLVRIQAYAFNATTRPIENGESKRSYSCPSMATRKLIHTE